MKEDYCMGQLIRYHAITRPLPAAEQQAVLDELIEEGKRNPITAPTTPLLRQFPDDIVGARMRTTPLTPAELAAIESAAALGGEQWKNVARDIQALPPRPET